MTMNLHTQTTAPKASQATSVSPLEQSGSSKTKFSRGKSKARAGAVKTDLYQTVTDSIIAALESGVKPWVCPWVRNGAAAGLPANFSTGTAYSGINIMLGFFAGTAEISGQVISQKAVLSVYTFFPYSQ